jgi:hypothetical protein
MVFSVNIFCIDIIMNMISTIQSMYASRRYKAPTIVNAFTLQYPNLYGRIYQNTIACSSNGQYVAFCASGCIYNSSNYGNTFVLTSVNAGMHTIAMNNTGQYQVAISTGDPMCNIYFSNDSGSTWVIKLVVGANNARWTESVCIDNTGQYIFVGSGGSAGSRNYVSKDFCQTFITMGQVLMRSSCTINNSTKKVLYIDSYNNAINSTLLTDAIPTETNLFPAIFSIAYSITSDSSGFNVAYTSRTQSGIAYSSNAGASFSLVSSPSFILMMYAGAVLWGCSSTTVYKSTNNGTDWLGVFSGASIKSMCVSSSNTFIYIVYTSGAIGTYAI